MNSWGLLCPLCWRRFEIIPTALPLVPPHARRPRQTYQDPCPGEGMRGIVEDQRQRNFRSRDPS
jgi:hypothetical protein